MTEGWFPNDGGMVPLRMVYEGKQFDSSHGQRTGTRKLTS
jgi:hypothetical protein